MIVYTNNNQKQLFVNQFKNSLQYSKMSLNQAWDWYYAEQVLKNYSSDFLKLKTLKAYNLDSTMRIFEGVVITKDHQEYEYFLAYRYYDELPMIITNYRFPYNI